jgi:hypothetical protein
VSWAQEWHDKSMAHVGAVILDFGLAAVSRFDAEAGHRIDEAVKVYAARSWSSSPMRLKAWMGGDRKYARLHRFSLTEGIPALCA